MIVPSRDHEEGEKRMEQEWPIWQRRQPVIYQRFDCWKPEITGKHFVAHEVVIADLDLDLIREVRDGWQFFRDLRPDQYTDLFRPGSKAV